MTNGHSAGNPATLWPVTPQYRPPSGGRFQSAETRRRQILDAAARLAVADGLDGTSIAAVASAAGLAKGSIYLHFASRRELMAALQADLWSRMLERPAALVADPAMTAPDTLDAVVEHLMRFEFDHHDLYHAVFHTVATEGDGPLAQAARLLTELLESGVASGDFDLGGIDSDTVRQFLLHGYAGPCFHHRDPDIAVRDVQRLFRRAVAAPAGP